MPATSERPQPLATEALIPGPDGVVELPFRADRGLYQFTIMGDARAFDWETLYVNFNLYGNSGQRTGPWDFNPLRNNIPAIPSYWVELDGRRLGLWFLSRPSVEDIAKRRMHGSMAFHIAEAGAHRLRFTPYSPETAAVRWTSTLLEPDPVDRLEDQSFNLDSWERRSPAGRLADPAFWDDLRQRVAGGSHRIYQPAIERSCAWIEARLTGGATERLPGSPEDLSKFYAENLLPLLFHFRLNRSQAALRGIHQLIDSALELPHWGNQREDGYGCDGDIGASYIIRALTWAVRSLPGELGAERRQRTIDRLRIQCGRFFDLALLHRDYWGGSILQDHGKLSLSSYGVAVLHLLGLVPEARLWASYVIPRLRRAAEAIPRDGSIPPSSYGRLFLYLDLPAVYRDTLVALTGEDHFRLPQFGEIPRFLANALRPADHAMVLPLWGDVPFIGGTAALNRLASVHRDPLAAALAAETLRSEGRSFYHEAERTGFFVGSLWGALSFDPGISAVPAIPRPAPLRWDRDSGIVQYHDAANDLTLSLTCGPWCGLHAYQSSLCPCDRLDSLAGAGHFIVHRRGRTLIMSPDGGYSMTSRVRNVMLVDGRGRYGDIDYPMSISGFRYRGEEIACTSWDAAAGQGLIRLNLTPAYPDEAGLVDYTRDFLLSARDGIVVRDRVILDRPRQLTWLFHGFEDQGLIQSGDGFRFGGDHGLGLAGRSEGHALRASVQRTETVKSYSSSARTYLHARFDAAEPVEALEIAFTVSCQA